MAKEFKPIIDSHCAVSLDNFVIVFGGVCRLKPLSTHLIWSYNLYTEEWRKHVIPYIRCAPEPFYGAVAAVVEKTIYTFGGRNAKDCVVRNALWKLSRTKEGGFTWCSINAQCIKKSPSPRFGHTGWEYAGKLWIFAGLGHSPDNYLNDHGDRIWDDFFLLAKNNQLLCFDPSIENWSNPQCFGSVPTPRNNHASVIIKDTVWLFGGSSGLKTYMNDVPVDIFELRMNTLTWNKIQNAQPHPQARSKCTLSVKDDKLVLHGGRTELCLWKSMPTVLSDTWIMDLRSHSWRQYTSRKDRARVFHTGSTGLNSVIIIGGCGETYQDTPEVIFSVMLEPKSLQQVAMQVILKHQNELPLNCLPMKLLSLLGISDKQNQELPSGSVS